MNGEIDFEALAERVDDDSLPDLGDACTLGGLLELLAEQCDGSIPNALGHVRHHMERGHGMSYPEALVAALEFWS